jgi:threonine/homoserine/homoserine lactone efflux protein
MFLIKGFLIGMFVSLLIGPLGLMAIQRTLSRGWKVGFLSAVGAVTSDMFYSYIAILGFTFVDDFINRHRHTINGITGILFLIVGVNILISGVEKRKSKEVSEYGRIHPFFLHFLMGLSNPMTFIVFFAIFTKVGINIGDKNMLQHIMFVISIFLGSCSVWFVTTNIIDKSKNNFKFENFLFVDKIIGAIIMLFGVYSVIRGALRF